MNANDIFNFAVDHIGEIFTVGSAFVAILSALAARRETRIQTDLMHLRLRQSIDASTLEWGASAIDTLGRAAAFARTRHLQTNDMTFAGGKTALQTTLSALVERGRMFFPNTDVDAKGHNKPSAFRGHRPPILDALVWVCMEIDAMTREGGPTADNSADFILDCRRLLVSELQAYLDPRYMDQMVQRYNGQSHKDRDEATHRSEALRAMLETRRPGLQAEGRTNIHRGTEVTQ